MNKEKVQKKTQILIEYIMAIQKLNCFFNKKHLHKKTDDLILFSINTKTKTQYNPKYIFLLSFI